MENQETPIAEGPLKPLLPESAYAHTPDNTEVEIKDSSSDDGRSTEEKLEGFKKAFFAMLDKQHIANLSVLNSIVFHTGYLQDELAAARLEALNQATDDQTREAIRWNFNIDVLIDRCYGLVDHLTTLRESLVNGESLQPIHDTGIDLAATAMLLASGLVNGMELKDKPKAEPLRSAAEQIIVNAGGRIEEGFITYTGEPSANVGEAIIYLVNNCGFTLSADSTVQTPQA